MNTLTSNGIVGMASDQSLKFFVISILWAILLVILAFGADYLIRQMFLKKLQNKLLYSKILFFKLLGEYNVVRTFGLLVPGLVVVIGCLIFEYISDTKTGIILSIYLQKTANLYNLFIFTLAINRFIFALHEYYQITENAEIKTHWHSYIKIISFFTWISMAILSASYVFNQSPTMIVTGLGAASAIVLLIFRDTILGIVASLQANASSIVRVGDYVTIPKHNIEGTIEDISINVVRIRNDDNTIATLPTYMLTTEIISNWRNIKESNARRFRFCIYVASHSIKFADEDLMNSIEQDILLKAKYSLNDQITNLTLYRTYLQSLLNESAEINHKFTNIVKSKTDKVGAVSLEVTAYTVETSSSIHEEIKAEFIEIFSAAAELFSLECYRE